LSFGRAALVAWGAKVSQVKPRGPALGLRVGPLTALEVALAENVQRRAVTLAAAVRPSLHAFLHEGLRPVRFGAEFALLNALKLLSRYRYGSGA
jgi:hypothetical protein